VASTPSGEKGRAVFGGLTCHLLLDVLRANRIASPWAWASQRATNTSRNTTFAPPASPPSGSMRLVTSAAQDVASIENEPERIVYCCERGCHFVLAYRPYEWKKAVIVDQPAIAAKLEELADRGGVGLTPHAVAIDRALAAVAAVNDTIDKRGSTGELKAFNRAFKDARKVDPGIRYFDYIHARKAAMLEALAQG
jgi:hypothetical protein